VTEHRNNTTQNNTVQKESLVHSTTDTLKRNLF